MTDVIVWVVIGLDLFYQVVITGLVIFLGSWVLKLQKRLAESEAEASVLKQAIVQIENWIVEVTKPTKVPAVAV